MAVKKLMIDERLGDNAAAELEVLKMVGVGGAGMGVGLKGLGPARGDKGSASCEHIRDPGSNEQE